MHFPSLIFTLFSAAVAVAARATAPDQKYCCPPQSLDPVPKDLSNHQIQGSYLVCDYGKPVETVCIYNTADGKPLEQVAVCPSKAATGCLESSATN